VSKELNYIINKHGVDSSARLPIVLPLTRIELAQLFAELNYKIGVEVGVEVGLYSEALCKSNPSMKLHCVDSWEAYEGYNELGKDRAMVNYKEASRRLEPYNCVINKAFSMDAVKDFEYNSVDFVYIDGNHDFKHVACDIADWSKVVRSGGIVSGHDFRRSKGTRYIMHVKDVVQAYAYAYAIRPWFVLNGDSVPSWMWVKQ
jgi:hypothetical protein